MRDSAQRRKDLIIFISDEREQRTRADRGTIAAVRRPARLSRVPSVISYRRGNLELAKSGSIHVGVGIPSAGRKSRLASYSNQNPYGIVAGRPGESRRADSGT